MVKQWIRVFYSDNGALTDYSIEAQNSDLIPFGVVAAEDYLYIGQYYPFNNFFVQVGTPNAVSSVSSIQYWNGQSWQNAVDVIDGTKVSGKTFARSGVIQFSPKRDEHWRVVYNTKDNNEPTELSTLELYDLYWIRLKVSVNLTGTATLKKLGYAFCSSEDLVTIDPDINEYLVPWGGASKTNWNDEIQLASQHIVADLKARQLVMSQGQVVRFDDVSLACAYRTLAFIYSGLGDPFKNKKDAAIGEYGSLMSIKRFTLDQNLDGQVQRSEISMSVGRLIR